MHERKVLKIIFGCEPEGVNRIMDKMHNVEVHNL
jgi:hypothetical protein